MNEINIFKDKTIEIDNNNVIKINNVKFMQNIGSKPIVFSKDRLNNNNNGFKLMPNDFIIFSSNISIYVKNFYNDLNNFITVSNGGY